MKIVLFNLSLFLLLFTCSCSTSIQSRRDYIPAYHSGNFTHTEASLSATINQAMPTENYQESNDATWLLLDRATTRFAAGDIDGAMADYRQAIEAIDFYSQELSMEILGKVLLQDELGAYITEDFEQILSRIYFALVLLHQGDESNALAILRQAEELQQFKRDTYARSELTKTYQLIDNAVGKYLLATLLERKQDLSNAKILYRQAEALSGQPFDPASSSGAIILLICHNGNSPHKISVVTNASVASLVAVEMILGTAEIPPSVSSYGGLPVPALVENGRSLPIPTYGCLDGQQKLLAPWYNINAVAKQQLEQKMPVIAARALARYMTRRAAVACAKEQNPDLGAFVDIGMLIANISTKADTRSWTTLPSSIDMARYGVSPGQHQLTISTAAGSKQTFTLNLASNDLCVINIFNIQPGITSIQIPQQFLINKECHQ